MSFVQRKATIGRRKVCWGDQPSPVVFAYNRHIQIKYVVLLKGIMFIAYETFYLGIKSRELWKPSSPLIKAAKAVER